MADSITQEISESDNEISDLNCIPPADDIVKKWISIQEELAKKVIILKDDEEEETISEINLIGGFDISFLKGDDVHAVVGFVVMDYSSDEDPLVVYEDMSIIHLTEPYVSGFLGFREVQFYEEQFKKLKNEKPHLVPQIILVDGNGRLHARGFGVASHLGILLDIPTIGVAKTLLCVKGIEKDDSFEDKKNKLLSAGDNFKLISSDGEVLGKAMRTTNLAKNPLFISVGHRVSLEHACSRVLNCCKVRIPEPVRQADLMSREYLRIHMEKHLENCTNIHLKSNFQCELQITSEDCEKAFNRPTLSIIDPSYGL